MIGALQTSRAEGLPQVSRAQQSAGRAAETREPARDPALPSGFRETRGSNVAGGTLIAAQIAASEESRTIEKPATDPKQSTTSGTELTEQEREQVKELQARDREVRAHEQAHATAGGQYAGAPEYEMEKGPDGRSYAVGGHVSISTSPIAGDPEATIAKMEVVKRAALAPVEPSGADRSVAADAESKRADARNELNAIRADEQQAALEESLGDSEAEDEAIRERDGARAAEQRSADAPAVPGLGPASADGRDEADRGGYGDESERDISGRSAQSDRREDDAISRDFAAFLNQSGTERTRADLQPGLATQRPSIDIRL